MIRKKAISVIAYIVCLSVILTLLPVTAWAKDNPTGGSLSEFPSADDTAHGDVNMVDNCGRIDKVNSNGLIINNCGSIGTFAGTLETNCSGATIDEVAGGVVKKNSGTIKKIDNQGCVETNLENGHIIESGRPVENNWGTIDNQYSDTVSHNYGSIGTVSRGASVSAHHDGTIGENNGSVTVTGEHYGVPKITTNKGNVTVENDPDNKAHLTIENNDGEITVRDGGKCTVINNNSGGSITVETGGSCEIVGTNFGTTSGHVIIKSDDGKTYYELILKNVENPSDINLLSNYKIVNNKIYVEVNPPAYSTKFTCSFDHSKYCVPWRGADSNPVDVPIRAFDAYCTIDATAGTFTIHFHKYDSYAQLDDEHKTMYPDQHNCKCSCGTEFALESCSGGEATCVSKATCEKCSAAYGNKNPNNHKHISDSWQNDSPYHWKECNDCNAQVNKTAHTYGAWITDTEAKIGVAGTKHRVCTACNYREDGTIPALKKEDGPTNPDNPSGGGNSSGENTEPENGSRGNSQQTVNPAKGNPTVIDVNTNATVDNSGNKAKAANNSATDIKKISPEEQNAESNDSTSNNGVDDEIIEITYNPDGTEVRNPVKTAEQVLTKSDNDTVNTKDGAKTSEQIENPKKSHTKAIAVAASVVGVTGAASGTWLFLKKRRL